MVRRTLGVAVLSCLVSGTAGAEETVRSADASGLSDDTRLFLAPTGRPLLKGEGYVSDHWIFFPGVAYGVTDNITLAGGVSVIPGIELKDEAFYFTPKIGARFGSKGALAVGGLLARAGGEPVSLGYVVGTYGGASSSLTAGLALGDAGNGDGESVPIAMVGGTHRVSKNVTLLTENWLVLEDDFALSRQPFSAGMRLSGGRLTVDVGVIVSKELLDVGFPIPWLSFSYHFGPRRAPALARRLYN
jgi:hypothetical protein